MVVVFAEYGMDLEVVLTLVPKFGMMIGMKRLGLLEPDISPSRFERCNALVDMMLEKAKEKARKEG